MKIINDLIVFNSCAKLKNFTQASIALSLTPSTVVKTIQKLEQYYGVKLFQRSTRAVELTEYGEILLEHTDNVILDMQKVETKYQNLNAQMSGRLKISLPNVEEIFTESLIIFMREYPNIKLDITFTDQYVDLISDRYDIVIRFGTLKDSELIAKKLGELQMLMVCSPIYSSTLKQYLLYKYPNTGKLEKWKNFKDEAISGNSIVLNSITSIKKLCLQGIGIAYLPNLLIKDELKNKTLIPLPNTEFETKEMHILWAKSGGVSPKKRLFIDFLLNYFNET